MLRPSIAAGSVLVALYTLSDFGVVSLMRYDALTRAIYQQYRSLFDRTPAAILGIALVALTALVLLAEARGRGDGRVRRSAAGADRPAGRVALGRGRWPALGLCAAVVGLALLVPVGVLGYWSTRPQRPGTEAGVGDLLGWAANSLLASGLAAAAAALAALPVAALAVRHRARWTRTLAQLTYGANALPGIVIALSLVFFATRVAEPALPDARAARVRLRGALPAPGAGRRRGRAGARRPAARAGGARAGGGSLAGRRADHRTAGRARASWPARRSSSCRP